MIWSHPAILQGPSLWDGKGLCSLNTARPTGPGAGSADTVCPGPGSPPGPSPGPPASLGMKPSRRKKRCVLTLL